MTTTITRTTLRIKLIDGNVEAENRPAPKKKAEPKRAAKKVATKEPKKKAKSGGK